MASANLGEMTMQAFFIIAYLVVGLIQFFAIQDGIAFATGMPSFVALVLAGLSTYIPVLGSILGVYGATNVWGWSLVQSLVLFFWFVPAFVLFLLFGFIADVFSKKS